MPTEKRPLARCAAHGLHYDPSTAGCVLCRSKRPPAGPPSSAAPVLASEKAATFSPPENHTWSMVRIVFAVAFVMVMTWIEGRLAGREPTLYDLAVSSGVLVLALVLSLAVKSFRTLKSGSQLAFWLSLLVLIGNVGRLGRAIAGADARAASNSGTLVEHGSESGGITISVPGDWTVEPVEQKEALKLMSPEGFVIGGVSVPKPENSADLGILLEEFKRNFASSYNATFFTATATMVGSHSALRSMWTGEHRGTAVKGYTYVTDGHTQRHVLFAVTEAENFDEHESFMTETLERARLE